MSSGPLSGAVLALFATGLWSQLPSWRWSEPEPTVTGGVQVSGPVTDSILTTFDCNCHCQDNTLVVCLLAFLCGLAAAFTCVCFCRRIRGTEEEAYEVPQAVPQVFRRITQQQPTLSIENGSRRAVVTPSSRR